MLSRFFVSTVALLRIREHTFARCAMRCAVSWASAAALSVPVARIASGASLESDLPPVTVPVVKLLFAGRKYYAFLKQLMLDKFQYI